MTPVGLPFADVGDMNFNHGNADGPDAVGNGDGSVGVSAWIHHHTVVLMIRLLQFVDEEAFVVRLIIIQLDVGEFSFHGLEMGFKRDVAIDLWLATA